MKVKAIAPWFGGKRTLAPAIVTQLGKHTQYFEPFCGSMAVLLAKPPSQKETVNDLHGELINLAHILQRESTALELYERCSRTLMCEGLLNDAKDFFKATHVRPRGDGAHKLERAYWYFLASWMGRNGTAGTERTDYQIAVRWTKNGGSPTVRWKNAVASIPDWHRRLSNVVILCRDAFRIIDRFEDHEATAIYVDSPYMDETRSSGANCRYLHDFASPVDPGSGGLFEAEEGPHQKLARILNEYKHARIVVSHYDCEEVRSLYEGWTFLSKTRPKHLSGPGRKSPGPMKEAPEVLIVNGPEFGE